MGISSKFKKKLRKALNPTAGVKSADPISSKLIGKAHEKVAPGAQKKVEDFIDPVTTVDRTHELFGLKSSGKDRPEDLALPPGVDDPTLVAQLDEEQRKLKRRRGLASTKLTGPGGLIKTDKNIRRKSLLA